MESRLLPDDPQLREVIGWKGIGVAYCGALSGERITFSIRKLERLPADGRTDRSARARDLLCIRSVPEDVLAAVFAEYPAAEDDDLLYRYILYALFARKLDRWSEEARIGEDVLEWIAGRRFYGGYVGETVLREISDRLPTFEHRGHYHSTSDPSKNRTRTIKRDGLSVGLKKRVSRALKGRASRNRLVCLGVDDEFDRGEPFSSEHAAKVRRSLRRELDEHLVLAPSQTSAGIWYRMNDRSPAFSERLLDHLDRAHDCLDDLQIEVIYPNGQIDEKASRRQKRYYRRILLAIAEQPKPFYTFSRRGRTDRIFPFNPSALLLPSDLRRILFQDFFELDLKSAHLIITAALWNASEALSSLSDPTFSIWDDFMLHFGLSNLDRSDVQYGILKDALKEATYSTVFGMDESAIAGTFTRATKEILGPEAGRVLRQHPILAELLECRQAQIEDIRLAGFINTPTGIDARLNLSMGRDEKSVLATAAQSYEQFFMEVLLEYEAEHSPEHKEDFEVVAWLHDGAYVSFGNEKDRVELLATGRNRVIDDLQRRLAERAGDFGIPSVFEAGPVYPDRWR